MDHGDDQITQKNLRNETSVLNDSLRSINNNMKSHVTPTCNDTVDKEKQTRISYLVLGDGDFSYSLDLCRYFHASLNLQRNRNNAINKDNSYTDLLAHNQSIIQVRATGIDSMDDLKSKYSDIDSILRKIRDLDTTNNSSTRHINHCKSNGKIRRSLGKRIRLDHNSVNETFVKTTNLKISIDHEVNAIRPWSSLSSHLDSPSSKPTELSSCSNEEYDSYHHVIFNHPHLGTEDAELHARFLSHLLHSARTHWLEKGGVIHITLVLNQCKRWKCLESAKAHSMVLLHRTSFQSPPSPGMVRRKIGATCHNTEEKSEDFHLYFRQRRHQNGRSFANRAKIGSEILTFGRSEDRSFFKHTVNIPILSNHRQQQLLPWLNIDWNTGDIDNETKLKIEFICPHCDKSFREERSRKNHIKSSHPQSDINNRVININTKSPSIAPPKSDFSCDLCEKENLATRLFSSLQALADHKQAKHFLFTEIKPEWAAVNKISKDENQTSECVPCESSKEQPAVVDHKQREQGEYCEVCNYHYRCTDSKTQHEREFLPESHSAQSTGTSNFHRCNKCDKLFKNLRALMQHQNFCGFNHKTLMNI